MARIITALFLVSLFVLPAALEIDSTPLDDESSVAEAETHERDLDASMAGLEAEHADAIQSVITDDAEALPVSQAPVLFTDLAKPGCYRSIIFNDDDKSVGVEGINPARGKDCIHQVELITFALHGRTLREDEDSIFGPKFDDGLDRIEVDFLSEGGSKERIGIVDTLKAQPEIRWDDGVVWKLMMPLTGSHHYEDPKHRECPHALTFDSGRVIFQGAHGEDGGHCLGKRALGSSKFIFHGHLHGNQIFFNLGEYGGSSHMVGTFVEDGNIKWNDGNVWVHQPGYGSDQEERQTHKVMEEDL